MKDTPSADVQDDAAANKERVDMFNRELPFVSDPLSAPERWPHGKVTLEEQSTLANGRTVVWYQNNQDMQMRKWNKAAAKFALQQSDQTEK